MANSKGAQRIVAGALVVLGIFALERGLGIPPHVFSHWLNLAFGIFASIYAVWAFFRHPERRVLSAMYAFWAAWALLNFAEDFFPRDSITAVILLDASIASVVGVIVMMHYVYPDLHRK